MRILAQILTFINKLKLVKLSVAVLMAVAVSLTSCKKEEVEPTAGSAPGINNNANSFTAKVDGSTFTPTSTISFSSSGVVYVTYGNAAGESIRVNFPEDAIVGTETLPSSGAFSAVYQLSSDVSDIYTAQSGTIEVTMNDTVNSIFKANVSFEAASTDPANTNTFSITQGVMVYNY